MIRVTPGTAVFAAAAIFGKIRLVKRMPDVIGSKLHFDAFWGECALRNVHDPGIVDENIDVRDVGSFHDLFRCLAARLLRAQIKD